jgi:hypothetical protein
MLARMTGGTSTPTNIVQLPHSGVEMSFVEALKQISLLPQILTLLQEQQRQISSLRSETARPFADTDGWLDAKAAAEYLSLSQSTFDKYRYNTSPKLTGCKLDGKTLYKKCDLDNFVRLYELRSCGFA